MSLHLTPEYLHEEYQVKGRSDRDIASEHGSYANAVRRLRLKYSIPSRDKAEAQELALKQGRHTHPTRGRPRDEASRRNISEGAAEAWKEKSEEAKAEHIRRAKEQWEQMDEPRRASMRQKAALAVREAAKNGSKLERFLFEELTSRGHFVVCHEGHLLPGDEELHIDLLLPDANLAIEIDGIAHFEPIWGQEYLEKRQAADRQKTNIILGAGMTLVRIKNTSRSLSEKRKRRFLSEVLAVLEQPRESRLLEVEVK